MDKIHPNYRLFMQSEWVWRKGEIMSTAHRVAQMRIIANLCLYLQSVELGLGSL